MNDYTPNISPQSKPRSKAKGYLYTLLAVTAICIAVGALCSVLALDGETRYFTTQTASIAVLAVFALCTLLSIVALFVFGKSEVSTVNIKTSVAKRLIFPEFAMMTVCTYFVLQPVAKKMSNAAKNDGNDAALTVIATALLLIALILGYLYSARFAFKNPSRTFISVMGICRIVFFLYIITTLYFDMVVELNSPFKLIIQFSAVAAALQTCIEVRNVISGASQRAYVAAKVLCATFGVLCFTLTCGAVAKGVPQPDSSYLIYAAYFATLALFSAYEIVCITRQSKPEAKEISERNDEI